MSPRRRLPQRGWILGRGTRVNGVTLALGPACEVTGRVLGDGKPVAGAILGRSHSLFLPARPLATTDPSGRYRVAGLVRTDVIEIKAPGFATVQRGAEELCEQRRADIELAGGVRFEGRVVDSRGVPVPDAEVAASELVHTVGGAGPLGGGYFTSTDAQGRFHVDDLPPNAGMMVIARHEEKGSAQLLTDQPGAAPFELRLETGGATVSGHVRYPDGQPVPGAVVYGRTSTGSDGSRERGDGTTSGAQGEYRLRHLGRGQGFVVANHRGAGSIVVSGKGTPQFAQIEVKRDDQALEGVDLVLPRRDGTVRGRVVDHQGNPLAGMSVFVVSSDPVLGGSLPSTLSGAGESTTTDLAGEFVVGGLPAATYSAWAAAADGRETPQVELTLPSKPVTLTFRPLPPGPRAP